MASKFGGVPVKAVVQSKFGGVPNDTSDNIGTPVPDTDSTEPTSTAAAIVEPLITLASAAVAEPIAGIAGIVQAINPFAEEGAGARAVEATREALTIQPGSESGRRGLEAVGEFLEPVGSALAATEKGLGDAAFKATDSPAIAAAAATIPTAVIELIGFAAGKSAVKASRGVKNRLKQGKIAREITDAAPSIEQLKDTARAVYKEIDEAGAVVKPGAYQFLVEKITREAQGAGLDPTITPKATQAISRFNELAGQPVTVTELDTLRKVAQNAAKSIEPAEASLGVRMIESIDEFLDEAGPEILSSGKDAGIGKKYKIARDMWGRARRSEMLEEAFEKARLQASGFENGVRTQFRAILNNKKKSRFFTASELASMKKVVTGGTGENLARLIGKLGFSEGSATNLVGGALGATAGGVAFGAPGAVAVPLIGQISRKLAQRMTVKGAEFADQVIRAGKDAKKITAAYLKNTPKAQRSAAELSELLTKGDIDLTLLPDSELTIPAKQLATQRRNDLARAATAGAAAQGEPIR